VRYRGARGKRPGYVCNTNAIELGEPRCQEVNATDVDPLVERLVLQALEPDKLALAVEAFAHLTRERAGLDHQWQLRLERARFEAERAKRQYDAVEPENRLVARNLERHWEAKLRAGEAVERDYAQWQGQQTTVLSTTDRQEILALGQNLPALWHAATTTPADRKRIIRLVVRDVILDRTRAPEQVWLQLNWQTGAMTQHWVPRHVTRYGERTNVAQLRERLQALKATGMQDQAIAVRLSTAGFSTGTGGPFTRGIVWSLRKRWGIGAVRPARTQGVQRQWPDGSYPLAGVADRIGVHIRTVHTWIARGMLVPSQAYKGGPLKIGLTEERIEALRDYVARVRRPRRAHGIGGASDGTLRTEAGASPGRPPHQLGAARGAQDHRQRARPAAVDTTTVTDGGHRHA